MINIRKGTEADIPAIIEMGRAYHQESYFKDMPFNEDKAKALIPVLIKTGLGIVAVEDEKVVGMMGAALQKHIFSDELMSKDILLYIQPEYRGQHIGQRLVCVYIDWALSVGVKAQNIEVGVNSGVQTESAIKFYRDLGFAVVGVNLRLEA
jgi:GNAT superfamily N-acetyltransferase